MNRISITHISNRHNDWLRGLSFYTGEINVLKNRLTELAGKNTGHDMLQMVEHYENQLIIHADQIKLLEHDINEHIGQLTNEATELKAGYIDGGLLLSHEQLEKRYMEEETMINQLRQEFNRFASRWM